MCDTTLSSSDFTSGTYRITTSGTYCISEDIEFNPSFGSDSSPNTATAWFPSDNSAFPGSTDQISGGAFTLGFFSVISIETNDVIIDLQGHEIKWSLRFYLQQRFGSIIEIGNSPFIAGVGPATFGSIFNNVNNIIIKNGILGLSSHHGIHGNGATNIIIQDLTIYDFEVGGIQLNGFNGATIRNINIGPSKQDVPLMGYYSNGRFLLLALRKLIDEINSNSLTMPSLTFAGSRTLTLQEIRDNLIESMDLVFRVIVGDITESSVSTNNNFILGKKLFMNTPQLPSGSALYGMVMNSKSVAVGGFGSSMNTDTTDGENLIIDNVNINDMKLNVNEIPGLYFDKCHDSSSTDNTLQKGPFGDIFDLRLVVSDSDLELIEQHSADNTIQEGKAGYARHDESCFFDC